MFGVAAAFTSAAATADAEHGHEDGDFGSHPGMTTLAIKHFLLIPYQYLRLSKATFFQMAN